MLKCMPLKIFQAGSMSQKNKITFREILTHSITNVDSKIKNKSEFLLTTLGIGDDPHIIRSHFKVPDPLHVLDKLLWHYQPRRFHPNLRHRHQS